MAKIIYRYACERNEELIHLLKEHGIKCEIVDSRFFVFHAYEQEIADDNLKKLIETHQITCFTSLQFTKKEMIEANWFSMWCNYNKIEPASGTTPFEYQCKYAPNRAGHRKQVLPYELKKTFSWGNHNFVSTLGNGTELFISSRARDILNDSQMKGLQYSPVYQVKSEFPCENIS